MENDTQPPPVSLLVPLAVITAVVLSLFGAFIGSGALGGTPIAEAAGGWLSTDATPLAPATAAFRVWSVIYVALLCYGVWQLSSAARSSSRQYALRPWAIASAVLNAAWVWTIQLDMLTASVLIIVALLVVLVRMLIIMRAIRPAHRLEAVASDGTFGLYLGWVSVATAANISAWLGSLGIEGPAGWDFMAAAVIGVVAILGMCLAAWTRGRISPPLTIAWGLIWVAVARSDGSFASDMVVWIAGISAAAVLIAAGLLRLKFWDQHRLTRAAG